MERRDRSLKALEDLIYIDSLDDDLRAKSLLKWFENYLQETSIESFNLTVSELNRLSELFYKNINFLKQHTKNLKSDLHTTTKIKEFLK